MEQIGVPLGITLILLVAVVSVAIGRQATASVERFRDEHHERFTRRDAE